MPNDVANQLFKRHLEGLLQSAQVYTDSSLKRERSVPQTQKLIRKLDLIADTEIGRLEESLEQMPEEKKAEWMPDCKAGCGWCCSQVVAATVPEVINLVEYLKQNFTADQLELVKQRAAEYRNAYKATPPGHNPMYFCPILDRERHLCSAHPGRPFACRGFFSLDVNKCKERLNNPDRNVAVSGITEIYTVAMKIRSGLRQSMKDHGLRTDLVVLGLAMDVLFNNPEAADEYLAGGFPFDSALPPEGFDLFSQSQANASTKVTS